MGGRPQELAQFLNWEMTHIMGSDRKWSVRQSENVHGAPPKLLQLNFLANLKNANNPESYSRLRRLGVNDEYMPSGIWPKIVEHDEKAAQQYSGDLAALLHSVALLTMAAPTAEHLTQVMPQIVADRFLPTFPAGSAWLLENDIRLSQRFANPRALLRADHPLDDIASGGSPRFRAAHELSSDTSLGLSAYLSPLLSSLAPRVWGITSARAGGIVIYVLGRTATGLRSVPGDALDLLLPGASISKPAEPDIPAEEFISALKWWTSHLDVVLSNASNPSNAAMAGVYSPQRAIERLLTIEQYFRHCQVIAINQRDPHSRRIALFAALDSLPGLNRSLQWDKVVNADFAQEVLDKLEDALPEDVKPVLLPRARGAVEALRELADEFFVKQWIEGEKILLPDSTDVDRAVPRHRAASQWLRVIRNSHHGFDQQATARDNRLLAMHTGHIDPALPDLAWLYLLDFMATPDLLMADQHRSPRTRRR
jgi:hypothetical protein